MQGRSWTSIPGISGELYQFDLWDLCEKLPDAPAVYIVSTRESVLPKCTSSPDIPCKIFCLAQTDNLRQSIANLPDLPNFQEEGADLVLAYVADKHDILTHIFEDVKAFCNL